MVRLRDVDNGLPLKSFRRVHVSLGPREMASSNPLPTEISPAITSIHQPGLLCLGERNGERGNPFSTFPSHELQPRSEGFFIPDAGGESILVPIPTVCVTWWRGFQVRIVACAGLEGLALSADGRMLATGEGNGMIKLRDVRSLEHEESLLGHGDKVTGLAWAPDGKTLASTSLDGTVRLWDVAAAGGWGSSATDAARDLKLQFSPDGSSWPAMAGHESCGSSCGRHRATNGR